MPRIVQGIIWEYRLSRALVAACCGAGLAICGAVLQALLRNVLAEPYVLGISAGASTGAVMIMLLGLGGGVIGISWALFSAPHWRSAWCCCWLRVPAAVRPR